MIEREKPYLEHPEILEYPTETWAAQDMRKCEVFQFAARHASPADRVRLLDRAEFFFRASIDRLSVMPTRTLCRPVVLLLSFGWSRSWFKQHLDPVALPPTLESIDFGKPQVFVPQKVEAIRRAKQLLVAGAAGGVLLIAALVVWLVW